MVCPIWSGCRVQVDGDGKLTIADNRKRVFYIVKPVSVQAMWSAFQCLNKELRIADACHYIPNGLSHTWIAHYESRLALSSETCKSEWHYTFNLTGDELRANHLERARQESTSPQVRQIRKELLSIMKQVDLADVTTKDLMTNLNSRVTFDLGPWKELIHKEMMILLGQMEEASEILPYLYLGTEWNASNLEELQARRIGFILNVTREIDNFFPHSFEYFNVRVADEPEVDMLQRWSETFDFITRARKSGRNCLVHCKMGISRSASTVIAYLMKQYHWELKATLSFVKARRNCIQPNPGFMNQLCLYESMVQKRVNVRSLEDRHRSVSSVLSSGDSGVGGELPRRRWPKPKRRLVRSFAARSSVPRSSIMPLPLSRDAAGHHLLELCSKSTEEGLCCNNSDCDVTVSTSENCLAEESARCRSERTEFERETDNGLELVLQQRPAHERQSLRSEGSASNGNVGCWPLPILQSVHKMTRVDKRALERSRLKDLQSRLLRRRANSLGSSGHSSDSAPEDQESAGSGHSSDDGHFLGGPGPRGRASGSGGGRQRQRSRSSSSDSGVSHDIYLSSSHPQEEEETKVVVVDRDQSISAIAISQDVTVELVPPPLLPSSCDPIVNADSALLLEATHSTSVNDDSTVDDDPSSSLSTKFSWSLSIGNESDASDSHRSRPRPTSCVSLPSSSSNRCETSETHDEMTRLVANGATRHISAPTRQISAPTRQSSATTRQIFATTRRGRPSAPSSSRRIPIPPDAVTDEAVQRCLSATATATSNCDVDGNDPVERVLLATRHLSTSDLSACQGKVGRARLQFEETLSSARERGGRGKDKDNLPSSKRSKSMGAFASRVERIASKLFSSRSTGKQHESATPPKPTKHAIIQLQGSHDSPRTKMLPSGTVTNKMLPVASGTVTNIVLPVASGTVTNKMLPVAAGTVTNKVLHVASGTVTKRAAQIQQTLSTTTTQPAGTRPKDTRQKQQQKGIPTAISTHQKMEAQGPVQFNKVHRAFGPKVADERRSYVKKLVRNFETTTSPLQKKNNKSNRMSAPAEMESNVESAVSSASTTSPPFDGAGLESVIRSRSRRSKASRQQLAATDMRMRYSVSEGFSCRSSVLVSPERARKRSSSLSTGGGVVSVDEWVGLGGKVGGFPAATDDMDHMMGMGRSCNPLWINL